MISATDAVLRNMARNQVKENFARAIENQTGVAYEFEYRFAADAKRRWRADVAWPAARVALEIDGGLWIYGRHNRAKGALADMEKMNGYAARGWYVFHAPWEWLEQPETAGRLMTQIVKIITARRREKNG